MYFGWCLLFACLVDGVYVIVVSRLPLLLFDLWLCLLMALYFGLNLAAVFGLVL